MQDITVTNPDDPFGCPSYDGPADQAHKYLIPGVYPTTDPAVAIAVTETNTVIVPVLSAADLT